MLISNADLTLSDVPTAPVAVDDLFFAAATFPGYEVWGGWDPCVLVANRVFAVSEQGGGLPVSLTLLRTALFFESRREKFIDYGGFGDDPAGYDEHHAYMEGLLTAVRDVVGADKRDDEDTIVAWWLEGNKPSWPPSSEPDEEDDGWLTFEEAAIDDDRIAAACGLTARMMGVDLVQGVTVDENRLRARLCLALSHLAPVLVEKERGVPLLGFRGAGPVDIVLCDRGSDEPIGLIEVKWSVDLSRDKIFEGAWDAVKLALAETPRACRWLITGAPDTSWDKTETLDLFSDGVIDTAELWHRPLYRRGPNGGMTVGGDCEAGARGNMFTDAPQRIRIKHVATEPIPGGGRTLRAVRIVGGEGRTVTFARAPEFPQRTTDHWLSSQVPEMPPDQYERLIAWLRLKRWTDADLASRVHPLRRQPSDQD